MKISAAITTSLNAGLSLLRSCAALRVGAIVIAGCVSAAPVLAESTPPLLPGEVYVKTQNGCGVIFPSGNSDKPEYSDAGRMKTISESTWTGACPNGLADGWGRVGKPGDAGESVGWQNEYAYGRQLWLKHAHMDAIHGPAISYGMDGRHAGFPNITDPFSPRWKEMFEKGVSTNLRDPDGINVHTWQTSCFADLKAFGGWFGGCKHDNQFQVYGVWVQVKSDRVITWCPDPKTPKGCEALWQEKAGPSIARIKAFVDEAEKKLAEDKRKYAELTVPWIEGEAARKIADAAEARRLADEANTKRLAEAAEAKRQEALKAIAREKDREVAAIEQQERDEYDAKEKEKSEKAFQASLKKLNAGELYALADKKRTAGELDKAREILLTLITKFPDNPLVALAAQQMSQLPAAPEVSPPMTKTPAPAQTKAPNRDAGLEEMSGAFGGPRK